MRRASVISSVTGAISSTVVTLSSSAENTAVTSDSMTSRPHGSAFTTLAALIATYWNTPLFCVMATMTIMPVSRLMVLRSMPWKASAWFSTPANTINPAPSSATTERLIFSVTMTA